MKQYAFIRYFIYLLSEETYRECSSDLAGFAFGVRVAWDHPTG